MLGKGKKVKKSKQGNDNGGIKPKRSISSKLLTVLLPMIAVAIVFIILVLSSRAKKIIVEQSYNALEQETVANANMFAGDIGKFIGQLDALAITLEQFEFKDNAAILKFLTDESTKFSKDAPNGIYLALDDGSWIDPSGWEPDADYVAADRPWYQDGIKNSSFALGAPYLDAVTNSMVVPVARAITLKDGRSGVAASDLSLASIMQTVSGLSPMGHGVTMLLDGDSILSYYNEEFNGTSVSDHPEDSYLQAMYADIASTGEVQEIKDGRTVYYADFEPVNGTTWTLISSVDEKDVMRELNQFQVVCWILALIVIVVIAVVMMKLISSIITKPVKELTENIIRITNSDFTVEVDDSGNDEIGLMNTNMKKFITHMRQSLGQMRDETNQLSEEALNSRSSSENMNSQAKEQSDSMEQIRGAMDGMSGAVSELATNATELAGMVSDLTQEGNTADETMKILVEKAGEGQRDMNVVTTSMDSISEAMKEMNDVVTTVDESAKKITGIVEMINSIAGQTNLLSLNASIEAARAGEAGKGFAVVATEIGSLANDSAEASREIGAIINEISGQISNLAAKSAANMEEIERSTASVATAGETFEEIFKNLDITGESMKKMIGMMSEIDNIASSVAAISEEQSASSEEVTATVETLAISAGEVADESQNVTDSANTVSQSAETINDFVATFKLE